MWKLYLRFVWSVSFLFAFCSAQSLNPKLCSRDIKTTYTQEEKDYFAEIAFGTEYGSSQVLIHKWSERVTVRVSGNPRMEDIQLVQSLITEINSVVNIPLLKFIPDEAKLEIYILPAREFRNYEPNYVAGNDGFGWLHWSSSGNIYKATILIDETLEPPFRQHIIREELTQVLGLANDSFRYEDSIFYQPYTFVTGYSPIDRTVMEMLYRCDVLSGTSYDQLPPILK
jgi:Protein of unknown function (DUF2927)